MKTKLIFLITICCFVFTTQAQKPFKELGLDHEVDYITLSDGRYIEYVENDTLRQIGSVMFNTQTNKVAYIIPEDELKKIKIARRDKEVSRFMSVDPLTSIYPHYTPYSFSGNKVIHRVEFEGKEDVKFDLPSQDPNIRLLDEDRIDHITKEEYMDIMQARGMVGAAGFIVYGGIVVVGYYGSAAVVTFIVEEATEEVIEYYTGVPIIIDPIDAAQWFAKKGYKKITKEALAKHSKEYIQSIKKTFIKGRNIGKTISGGKQGKHIVGHNNYKVLKNDGKNPSILNTDAQKLLDDIHSGNFKKSDAINNYKTRVEFDDVIGYYVNKETGEKFETTVGIVINSKDGVHIVPAKPINN